MKNIVNDSVPKDFFVWIDPKNFLIQHNVGLIGSFTSTPPNEEKLMFIPNPFYKEFISPFQNNLLLNYKAEYNLEITRHEYFNNYPPRLEAIYLLPSEEEALKYRSNNLNHVGERILKKVYTVGEYTYSSHDSSLIDFLRLNHSMGVEDIDFLTKAYWNGWYSKDIKLALFGKEWTREPIVEILFCGRVNFYDKSLNVE